MNTKEKITLTAFKTFLEKGYKSTTYAELINAAEVSKGAFYHYFKNKEELFFAVIDHYFLRFYTQINWDKINEIPKNEFEKEMKRFYINVINQINELSDKGVSRYFILFFEALELYPEFKNKVRKFYAALTEITKTKLEITQEKSTELIAKYEGYLFLLGVFPEYNIENLIK